MKSSVIKYRPRIIVVEKIIKKQLQSVVFILNLVFLGMQDQDPIVTIRTLECDACRRFDSVMLTASEIKARTSINEMEVAAYSIPHHDHTRIIYFDNTAQYLGDTIAFKDEELPDIVKTESIPFYILNTQKVNIFRKIRQKILDKIYNKHLSITITGPSRAGKTSLVRYLNTLIPERESGIFSSVPTMGKSTKHITFGSTVLKTMDMGGQRDFWDLWEEPVKNSDLLFFILDATSNNMLEIAEAFETIISYRSSETPLLVILNKKDLHLTGKAQKFSNSNEFLSLTKLSLPLPRTKAIEASIFEGIAYIDNEEIPLGEVLSTFLQEYC